MILERQAVPATEPRRVNLTQALGDYSGIVVVGLLAACTALTLFISLRRRREIYPASADEKSRSVFDDPPERAMLTHDATKVDLGSLDAWQPDRDGWNDSSQSGGGGSFGGGGASGKW